MSPLPGSRFTQFDVPMLLWPDLLQTYGAGYEYHTAEGETITGLTGILLEGVDDEARSPGRYARFWVDRRDLSREPMSSDWVLVGEDRYDVERVDATLYKLARLVIKLQGDSWQGRR